MNRVCEAKVIKEVGNYKVVELYANSISDNGEKPYYGDIYETMEDAKKEHPNCLIITGYGIIDETGYSPENTLDWYDIPEDAEQYIYEKLEV